MGFDSTAFDQNAFDPNAFEMEGAAVGATLSDPTPSGTLGTQAEATIGATTDQVSGTFYCVVDLAAELVGITAAQIIAGDNANDVAAIAAANAAVSDVTPSADVGGLTLDTLYSYAAVQVNDNGNSNVVTGTFTTADTPGEFASGSGRARDRRRRGFATTLYGR